MNSIIFSLLYQDFLGNKILDYIIGIVTFLTGIFLIWIIKTIIIKRLKGLANKTKTVIDDFIVTQLESKAINLLYFGAFYLGLEGLVLHPILRTVLNFLALGLVTAMGAGVIITISNVLLKSYWDKTQGNKEQDLIYNAVNKTIQIVIWIVALLIFLDNLGVEITALVAGLGIGGVAIAFAAQAILSDIFSFFTIFFDRPFEIGDFIIVDDFMGTIELVGIKTTRIRSLTGEQVIFSNTDLTNSRVRNYKRMQYRRVVFSIGVTYDTTLAHLKEIPEIIKDIIVPIENTVFDRTHFFSYGDFSLNYEIVYYVKDRDYNKYMDIQQAINFRIKEEFDRRGIEFAFPTQTLYMKKSV